MTRDTDYCQIAGLCDDYKGMKQSIENRVADQIFEHLGIKISKNFKNLLFL